MIERRVRAAADGDFVVTFYNPRSRARDWQLRAALDLLGAHRPQHARRDYPQRQPAGPAHHRDHTREARYGHR